MVIPLTQTRNETNILVPPAGRAEFIVTAPPTGGTAVFFTNQYDTGPTGNFLDLSENLANIETTSNAVAASRMPKATPPTAAEVSKVFQSGDASPRPSSAIFISPERIRRHQRTHPVLHH